jgi:hypothetical protein
MIAYLPFRAGHATPGSGSWAQCGKLVSPPVVMVEVERRPGAKVPVALEKNEQRMGLNR